MSSKPDCRFCPEGVARKLTKVFWIAFRRRWRTKDREPSWRVPCAESWSSRLSSVSRRPSTISASAKPFWDIVSFKICPLAARGLFLSANYRTHELPTRCRDPILRDLTSHSSSLSPSHHASPHPPSLIRGVSFSSTCEPSFILRWSVMSDALL